jgi:hypothetical protein
MDTSLLLSKYEKMNLIFLAIVPSVHKNSLGIYELPILRGKTQTMAKQIKKSLIDMYSEV